MWLNKRNAIADSTSNNGFFCFCTSDVCHCSITAIVEDHSKTLLKDYTILITYVQEKLIQKVVEKGGFSFESKLKKLGLLARADLNR